MKKLLPTAVMLLAAFGAPLAHAGNDSAVKRFEALRTLELKALDARSTILAAERTCIQGAGTYPQVNECRDAAQRSREALGRELRPQYEALAHRNRSGAR